MANVVRFALSTAKTLYVPGAGTFIDGILDVDANNLRLLTKTRYLVQPYRAVELGTMDAATPKPTLPAVPGPPAPDPYPQYLTAAEAASSPELRAALVPFWKPSTAYSAGQWVLDPGSGDVVSAKVAFTSGASFDATDWYYGVPPTSGIPTIKPNGDGRSGVWQYTNDDASGYIFHLTAGPNTTANSAVFAVGTDWGAGAGLLISHKNAGVGLNIVGNPSSTAAAAAIASYSQASAAYALAINLYAGSKSPRIVVNTGAGFADGAMTAGSPVLTSATANFVAGDVGQTVSQMTSRGEGFGIPTATIVSVESTTSCTLSASATKTVSGANFKVTGRAPAAGLTMLQILDTDGSPLYSWARSQSFGWKPHEFLTTSGANPTTIFIDGSNARFYGHNGSNYNATYVSVASNLWRVRSYAAANKGSESSFTDMLQVKKDQLGFFGTAPIAKPAVGAAATDAATTQTLANNLRTALINLGLVTT